MSLRRPARLLFLSAPREPELADRAEYWAARVASGWIEARAGSAALLASGQVGRADDPDLAWADTVVALLRSEAPTSIAPSAVRRLKCWRLPPGLTGNALDSFLRRRLSGMVGGLRLLAAMED